MAFTESLVVRILGDSSGLRQEISTVLSDLAQLQQQATDFGSLGDDIASSFTRLSGAMRSVNQLSNELARVSQQAQMISRQPVTLNVQPALQALQQLMVTIQQVAMQMRALSAASAMRGAVSMGGWSGPVGRMGTGFSEGGIVQGPEGHDRVPANLTAGEFVIRREAVSTLGLPFLNQLNQTSQQRRISNGLTLPSSESATGSLSSSSNDFRQTQMMPAVAPQRVAAMPSNSHESAGIQSTVHYGGIQIHVRETVDAERFLADLQRQDAGLRNRRG